MRDRSSSAEKEKRIPEQPKVVTTAADAQKHSSLGLITAMSNAGTILFETKFSELQKAVKKLKEEFIPKRIERAIETLEEKIKLGQVKTN